jgi:D-alanyl-D-alanine carboxypeptidase/D-alanyl-D-alanine-endopeptidase (penicillin-binding protein 4)
VLKSVVTASALEILGVDYRFATSIAYSGEIRGGVLYGNIYIIGGGDPTLNSSKSANPRDKIIKIWYDSIRSLGIREVRGCVIADGSIFDL